MKKESAAFSFIGDEIHSLRSDSGKENKFNWCAETSLLHEEVCFHPAQKGISQPSCVCRYSITSPVALSFIMKEIK